MRRTQSDGNSEGLRLTKWLRRFEALNDGCQVKTLLPLKDKSLASRAASRGTDPPRPRLAGLPVKGLALPAIEAASSAAARQSSQLPTFAPLMEEIEVAGWSSHRRRLTGNFHDWLLLGDGRLVVTVGQTAGDETCDPMEQALVAQAAWTAIRAHAVHARDAGTLLSLAARTLWPVPTANVHAHVAVALIDSVDGNASLAMAGEALVWRIRAATTEQILGDQPPLGTAVDVSYRTHRLELALRERLLLVADDPLRRTNRLVASVAASFSHLDAESHRRMTAADTAALARQEYEDAAEHDPDVAASIIAVRRR